MDWKTISILTEKQEKAPLTLEEREQWWLAISEPVNMVKKLVKKETIKNEKAI